MALEKGRLASAPVSPVVEDQHVAVGQQGGVVLLGDGIVAQLPDDFIGGFFR